MKIGIDIDDTTFIMKKFEFEYADRYAKYLGKTPNKDLIGKIKTKDYLYQIYGFDDATVYDFAKKYASKVFEKCIPLENANEIIKKLKSEGNTIHFVSARLTDVLNCDTEAITKNSLKKYQIPYDTLNLHVQDKATFFLENGIEIGIDDSFNTCKKLKTQGIYAILMTSEFNKKIDNGNIPRANNWLEVYKIIKEYEKNNQK